MQNFEGNIVLVGLKRMKRFTDIKNRFVEVIWGAPEGRLGADGVEFLSMDGFGANGLLFKEGRLGIAPARFSDYFASMGFAGEVALYEGNHETDYANFGIDILVKHRDNLQLQKLTPHLQSGGERSVATALYMLALQELTVVPFRCVDEINQGMDAVNERRVFDLLVRTSCKETSAQYFLLTPKLLSNLNYDENMTVLVVNNGEGMCHHSDWDVDRFIAAASRA